MTPEQIIAAAEVAGSPALLALVHGHLNNGHPALAAACLAIPPVKLAILDAAFALALDMAAEAGAVAAAMAAIGGEADDAERASRQNRGPAC